MTSSAQKTHSVKHRVHNQLNQINGVRSAMETAVQVKLSGLRVLDTQELHLAESYSKTLLASHYTTFFIDSYNTLSVLSY